MTEETTTTKPRTRKPRASTRDVAQNAVAKVEKAQGGEPGKIAPKPKETVQQLKNRLRNEAEREVLNDHKHEVIAKTEAKYKEHGLEYVRRLSDEEKAAKEIADNLEKYPGLREQMMRQLGIATLTPNAVEKRGMAFEEQGQGAVGDNGGALLAAGTGPQAYPPFGEDEADPTRPTEVEHREGE